MLFSIYICMIHNNYIYSFVPLKYIHTKGRYTAEKCLNLKINLRRIVFSPQVEKVRAKASKSATFSTSWVYLLTMVLFGIYILGFVVKGGWVDSYKPDMDLLRVL